MSRPDYTFVIPVHNEVETLPELHRRLVGVFEQLDGPVEAVIVDDGSRDGSYDRLCDFSQSDPRFKVIRLSRNFGHQLAITAGIDHASGRAVIIMDADLQDPPEVALELAKRWREGHHVVYAVRQTRQGETMAKRWTASLFYRLLSRLTATSVPADVGDFRLVDERALDAFKQMRETNRYVRGMFAWIGFDQVGVPYTRDARYAGETKYPLRKMVKLALDAIITFSDVPLRFALGFGFVVSIGSFLFGIAAIISKVAGLFTVPGWSSIAVAVSFVGGVQLIVLGMTGLYIGRIYDEVKKRPLYLVRELRGFDDRG